MPPHLGRRPCLPSGGSFLQLPPVPQRVGGVEGEGPLLALQQGAAGGLVAGLPLLLLGQHGMIPALSGVSVQGQFLEKVPTSSDRRVGGLLACCCCCCRWVSMVWICTSFALIGWESSSNSRCQQTRRGGGIFCRHLVHRTWCLLLYWLRIRRGEGRRTIPPLLLACPQLFAESAWPHSDRKSFHTMRDIAHSCNMSMQGYWKVEL